MTIKAQEDFIRVEVVAAENTVQTVVEDALSLPSYKRHCDRILKSKAKPRITAQKVEEDKVAVEGIVDISMVYVSEEELEDSFEYHYDSAHWANAIPFTYFIDVPGAEPGMVPKTSVEVEDLHLEVKNDGLVVEADAVLNLNAKVIRYDDIDLVTGCNALPPNKIKVEKDVIHVEDFMGAEEEVLDLSDSLELALGKPAVSQLLDYSVEPDVFEVETTVERVRVRGYVSYKVMYSSGTEPSVAFAEWVDATPFEVVIDVPEARPGMKAVASVEVVNANVEYVENNLLAADEKVKVTVKVIDPRQINVVTDIISESDHEIATRYELIKVVDVVGQGNKSLSTDGVIDLPEPNPPIEQILDFVGNAKVDEVRVGNNRVTVEGHLDVSCAYIAHSETEQPVHYVKWEGAVPFTANIDVQGAEPGMSYEVDLLVTECEPDLINRETIEVQSVVSVSARVTEVIEKDIVVEAIDVPVIETRPATIVCLIVQPGDSLWKLAKRYRTSEAEILSANPWLMEEPGELEVGWRIFIPKAAEAV